MVVSLNREVLGRSSGRFTSGRTINSYSVDALLQNKSTVRICKVQGYGEGAYVEKVIEDRLGIIDNPEFDNIVPDYSDRF